MLPIVQVFFSFFNFRNVSAVDEAASEDPDRIVPVLDTSDPALADITQAFNAELAAFAYAVTSSHSHK